MVNPYSPDSKEYAILNNLIELIDHIDDYSHHCAPDGKHIDCAVIRQLIEAHTEIHNTILKEE